MTGPRYRVVRRSAVTGRVLKVLIRDLSLEAAEVYRSGYGPSGSWRVVVAVEREPEARS